MSLKWQILLNEMLFTISRNNYAELSIGMFQSLYLPRQCLMNTKKTKVVGTTTRQDFYKLIKQRQIEKIDSACLLCSEDKPHHCHRRTVPNVVELTVDLG